MGMGNVLAHFAAVILSFQKKQIPFTSSFFDKGFTCRAMMRTVRHLPEAAGP